MSRVSLPNPPPPGDSPLVDQEAQRQRQNAQNQALAEAKSTGRGSTIVAGAQIANDAQSARGATRRARQAALDLQ